MCDGRAERSNALKPFVACRDLIIVNRLYTRDLLREITINECRDNARSVSGVTGTLPAVSDEETGGVCG
jgi:hypothetical protein